MSCIIQTSYLDLQFDEESVFDVFKMNRKPYDTQKTKLKLMLLQQQWQWLTACSQSLYTTTRVPECGWNHYPRVRKPKIIIFEEIMLLVIFQGQHPGGFWCFDCHRVPNSFRKHQNGFLIKFGVYAQCLDDTGPPSSAQWWNTGISKNSSNLFAI